MLWQFVLAALIVGPVVWVFFHIYFQCKQNGTRLAMFQGIVFGVLFAGWIAITFYAGYSGVFIGD